jgi:AcrR family transcriptional regulator
MTVDGTVPTEDTTSATTRYVDAARELAAHSGAASFTVQQVVRAAGGSLKDFYRHVSGKDDLLCALFAEDCTAGAEVLAAMVDRHDDPEARVGAWVTGLFTLMSAGESRYVQVLVREHRRLAETRPAQLDAAVDPLLAVLRTELAAHGDPRPSATASHVFDLALVTIHDLVLGRRPDTTAAVDDLWRFCWGGIAGAGGPER